MSDRTPPSHSTDAAASLRARWEHHFGISISVIDPLLFVGGQFSPDVWPLMHELGLRAVLSLQAERHDRFSGPPPARTLRIAVPDFTAPSLAQLAEGVAFIAEAHAADLPVYIHCHAGMGRAPTMAAAYLVARRGLSPAEAISLLVEARPIVDPSREQLERLVQWADHCKK
jgi:protein-tyrosine phosphatase